MTTPDLFAAGRLLGAHRWWELSAFELLGHWAGRVSNPSAKGLLDRHSGHAAWRSAQWADRLPVLAGVDHGELVQPPTPEAKDAVAKMRTLGHDLEGHDLDGEYPDNDEAGDTAELDVLLIAAAYRVLLPRRAVAYQAHQASASSVSEPSVVRTLGQVATDVAGDWAEGEAHLQALITDRHLAGVAAGCVAGLDSVLAGDPELNRG